MVLVLINSIVILQLIKNNIQINIPTIVYKNVYQ